MESRTHLIEENLRVNSPELIVLHSTHNYSTFEELMHYHLNRGFAGVGYHLFIDSEGNSYQARPFNREGAHALGFNTRSLGVCYHVNQDGITPERASHVKSVVDDLTQLFAIDEVIPHTLAQIRFFNSLLEDKYKIQETIDICKPDVFSHYRDYVRDAATHIKDNAQIYYELKKFKNCPGPTFYEVMQ